MTPAEAAAAQTPSGFPHEDLVRSDRLPHIWCPECGIGTAVSCFTAAMTRLNLDPDRVAIVSGIGCSGRVAGYLKLDSFHTTHGRAIPFATGLKMGNPKLKVVVFSGDGDLISIGGNHFIHAARRNVDMTVICVNNFNYAMTGGQVGPTTPLESICSTTPYGNYEHPFNLAALAASCGAVYVARWTVLHVRRLIHAFEEALAKRGFSFVEAVSPCPTLFTRRNKLGSGLDLMRDYRDRAMVMNGASPQEVEIKSDGRIPIGKFVDIDKPTLEDTLDNSMKKTLGDSYTKFEGRQRGRSEQRALIDV